MLNDLIEIVIGNMAEFADSGNMVRNGAEFFETPFELIAIYNTDEVDYIIYQEEGYTHYKSGQFIDVNKGFISEKAEGKINRFIYSEQLGIPYNKLENDQILLENNTKIMSELGATINV